MTVPTIAGRTTSTLTLSTALLSANGDEVMTEPTELRGIEGLREALKDPDQWEAIDARGKWVGHAVWGNWTANAYGWHGQEWRRIPIPEPVRPTEAELVAALRAGKEVNEFDSESDSLIASHQKAEVLRSELDSERAARQKAEQLLDEEQFACAGWISKCEALEASVLQVNSERQDARGQLTSALETIDALTRWRLQSEEPCPDIKSLAYVQVTDNPEDAFPVGVTPGEAHIYKYWRFTPESWAEFCKTKEGGSDGE
jgi:hypothetical protein